MECYWADELAKLSILRVSRCFRPTDLPLSRSESRLVATASSVAFGAVAYLRTQFNNKVHVCFVMAKCLSASLRPTTIPRMELQAAELAVHLSVLKISSVSLIPPSNTTPTPRLFCGSCAPMITGTRRLCTQEERKFSPTRCSTICNSFASAKFRPTNVLVVSRRKILLLAAVGLPAPLFLWMRHMLQRPLTFMPLSLLKRRMT